MNSPDCRNPGADQGTRGDAARGAMDARVRPDTTVPGDDAAASRPDTMPAADMAAMTDMSSTPADMSMTPADAMVAQPDAAVAQPDAMVAQPDAMVAQPDAAAPPPARDYKIVGYFAEWGIYDRNFQVADIPAQHITHVNYAFINPTENGRCAIMDDWAVNNHQGGNFANLRNLVVEHPHLKIMLSLGGWTLSGQFSNLAFTPENRRTFVESCVQMMVDQGFHGIDVDWEYPVGGGLGSNAARPEDRANYTLLLAEFRRQLDARGDYLLTIAAPAGPSIIPNLDLPGIAAQVDWINVMTYDLNGSWSPMTGHNAPMRAPADAEGDLVQVSARAAVQTYLDGGVPPEKLVLGLPFYGRGFARVGPENNGLHQPFVGVPQGTHEPAFFDYHDLRANYVNNPAYARFVDAHAQTPYLYNAADQVFISYDDLESFGHKLDYIEELGLGGAMYWEMAGDTRDLELTRFISGRLRPRDP